MHLLDLSHWLAGPLPLHSALLRTQFWDTPVEDNAALILGERDSRTRPWAMLHVSWTEWKNMFSLEIYCRTAKLQVDGLVRSYGPQRLTHLPDGPELGPPEVEEIDYPDEDVSWEREWASFAAALEADDARAAQRRSRTTHATRGRRSRRRTPSGPYAADATRRWRVDRAPGARDGRIAGDRARACAMALARARMACRARRPRRARRSRRRALSCPGDGHEAVALDVSDEDGWEQVAPRLRGASTGSSARPPCSTRSGRSASYAAADFRRTLEVNVLGTLLAVEHCLPALRAGGGAVVTFSGGGATAPLPRFDAYAASKAAVARLSENLASELAGCGVRVNCVAPGFVATDIHEATLAAGPELAGTRLLRAHACGARARRRPASEAAELVCAAAERRPARAVHRAS